MQAGQFLATAFAVLGFAAAAAASLHALLYKRRPQSAFAWIAVCLTLPLARRAALLPVRHQPRADAGPQAVDAPSRARLPDRVRRHAAAAAPAARAARLRRQRLAADGRQPRRAPARRRRHLRRDDRRDRAGTRVRLLQHLHLRRRPARPAVRGGALRRRGARRRRARAARRRRRVVLVAPREHVAARHARALRAVPTAAAVCRRPSASTCATIARFSSSTASKRSRAASTCATAISTAGELRIVDLHFRLSGPVLAQIETVFLRDWQFATGDASRRRATRAATDGRGAVPRRRRRPGRGARPVDGAAHGRHRRARGSASRS